MATYTTRLGGWPVDKPKITKEEAVAMIEAGFRFSIYDLGNDEFRLSIPYQTAWTVEKDTLTFMQ